MSARGVAIANAVLLDIEGTTTPVAFVTDVLFPYARAHVRTHFEAHADAPEYRGILTELRGEHIAAVRAGESVPPWDDAAFAPLDAAIAFVEWLMARDRKSTALKDLQGRIWEEGYRRGGLIADVFPDVRPALQRWEDRQVPVGIFSSGSVLAQQLLFRHSSAGDLTHFLRWHFDTRVGSKGDAESYRRIAASCGVPTEGWLFVSDAPAELNAARQAGMQVRLAVRPGNSPVAEGDSYEAIRSLEEISWPA